MKFSSLQLARKIREMKRGQTFEVSTEQERQSASKAGKTLKNAGVIDFNITTQSTERNTFLIVAA